MNSRVFETSKLKDSTYRRYLETTVWYYGTKFNGFANLGLLFFGVKLQDRNLSAQTRRRYWRKLCWNSTGHLL